VNDVAMIDKNMSMERTPQLIAIEINSIKEQTRKMVLFNSIEIGRRLAEAKLMIKHGEWGEWLSKSVDYSQRTASNLMAIFEQYGSSQITLFCDNAKSQALANLSYTQAVALLGIPQEEREAFIEENDIDSMSTRELQQAIKDRDYALNKAQELQDALTVAKNNITVIADDRDKFRNEKLKAESTLRTTDEILRDYQDKSSRLEKALRSEKEKTEEARGVLDKAIAENRKLLKDAEASGNNDEVKRINELLQESDSELFEAHKKIEELERQLKETPIEVTAAPVIEKVPEEVERELNELRERTKELEAKGFQPISTATIRFKFHFDSLVKGFGDLLSVLEEIDIDEREKYKNAIKGLMGKMVEKL